MSSNDDSPAPQPHSVQPGLSATSNKNPKIDTVDALLRTIFRMGWTDWTLTAILISCLINHYFFIILNVAQPIIDFTRLITALISVIFIAYKVVSGYKSKELITIFFKNHPLQLFVSIIACGATVSFFLPLILNLFRFIGETDKLTTALLASTGGVIAVFTLIKTHQKNQNDEQTLDLDRKKYNQQIKDRMEDLKLQEAERLEQKEQFEKNLEAQSEKNKQDHTRQAHAERRSRYAKAVEQLANEKAAVRLGGIYTLVGLVDEWLADDTLEQEEQQKEGQVIINNLCSYVRSPFTLALKAEMFEGDSEPDNYEGDFSKDQAAFHEEQDVRRTVFVEMSKRSSTFNRGLFGQIINTSLRMWSDFDFDFSRAPIFYPLNAITIEKGNFSGAKFYADANFFGATFISNADFSGAAFTQNANFSGAAFAQNADFIWAAFAQNADFSGATFTQNVNFSEATFTQNADFDEAVFFENANFSWAAFFEDANFSWATFTQNADFRGAKFTQNANFSGAAFIENANFSWAKFTQNADFHGAEFTQNADFS
ncbi:pentapeptide repeat-containing protein, partial [Rothia mucilaginosa]|uniref:pentapeptide repeat-containing protein n=2 Tax=Rothia mucilaginosa TaxID=43675 RepID=UPI00069E36C9